MEENQQNLGATPPAEIGGAPAAAAVLQTSVQADHDQQPTHEGMAGMDMDVEADKPTTTSSSSTFTFAGTGDATAASVVVPDSLAVAAPATASMGGGHMEEELRPVLPSTATTTSMPSGTMEPVDAGKQEQQHITSAVAVAAVATEGMPHHHLHHHQQHQQQIVKQEQRESEGMEEEDEEELAVDDLQAAAMAAQAPSWPVPVDSDAATVAARTAAAAPLLLRPVDDSVAGNEEEEEDDEDGDELEAAMLEGGDEDEEGGGRKGGNKGDFDAGDIPRTKHEITPAQMKEEVETLFIPENAGLELAGTVEGIVEGFLVINVHTGRPTLDIDSILAFQDRTPLGKVFEVFGPVKKPYYSVVNAYVERLKSAGKEHLIAKGTPVFYVPTASSFVVPSAIYAKGSDASGEHDEEPPDDELEFSDDEQEQMFRRQRKQQRMQGKRRAQQQIEGNAELDLRMLQASTGAPERGRGGRRRAGNRGGFAGGGWSRPTNAMPYAAPGEYTPLQRPAHLVDHVMSNPAYGAPYQQHAPPPQAYGHVYPAYGGAHPYAPAPTAGAPPTPTMALPLPHPSQMAYQAQMYPTSQPQAQASWQNQFYASPHHHPSS